MKSCIFVFGVCLVLSAPNPFARSSAQTAKPTPATAKSRAKTPLPPAVEAAFKTAYPNAIIKRVSKEREGGHDVYEVESIDAGLARDINYLADGTIVDIEEAINAADVPPAVAAALTKRYPTAKIIKREKLTEGAKVSYEFQLAGVRIKDAVIAPDGTFVSPK